MNKKVDVFPAVILIAPPDSLEDYKDLPVKGDKPQGTRRLDRCRVAIVNSILHVAADSPEGPKLVFRERVLDYHKNLSNISHHAITESGKIIAFSKDENCGCGSRLRSWNPFGNYLSAAGDPDE
jgi:hypothetical protein